MDDVVDVEEEEGCGECAALGDTVCDGLCFGLCVLRMCRLLPVVEVGCKECYCGWCEVEDVSEFVEELGVGDCVICFGEVYVDGYGWVFLFDVCVEFVNDGLEC